MGKRPPHAIVSEWDDCIDPESRDVPRPLYEAYCLKAFGYRTAVEAFARSEMGEQLYDLHAHGNVSLVDRQSEMIPIQRQFLLYAADEHEPDPNESAQSTPNTPPTPNF